MDFLRNYFVVLLALILVFVLNVSFTLGDNKVDANYDFEKYKVLKVKEARLLLECNSTDSSSSHPPSVKWLKEGNPVDGKQELVEEVNGGKLTLKRSSWDDYRLLGNYSCVFNHANSTNELGRAEIYVVAKPYVKIHPSQLVFVEGQKLEIECLVYGKPSPLIAWQFENKTYDKSEGRVKITTSEVDNLVKSLFVIDQSAKSDRGEYTCIAQNVADNNPSDKEFSKTVCFVRIKDKYAALWPFLGICVEVVVLCAIIFIYEKKRNKAELEESDTDQSPEQKNTPDHGKESVRQRK